KNIDSKMSFKCLGRLILRNRKVDLDMSKPKIVVLGAGYAGLKTMKDLTKSLAPEEADLVLVNKHNYHYETTWLHEDAGGTSKTNQVRIKLSDVLSPNRVRVIYDEVAEVQRDDQRVIVDNGEITYDYLVIALGFESNTCGIKGMEENAFAIVDNDSSREI